MLPTIFIIDDNEAIHEVIKSYLEKSLKIKANVVCYFSAQEFLDTYQPFQHGCLLLDNIMPGMTGVELHEQLRIRKCFIPIIMMTSHADVSLAVSEMKKGLFYFVEKPFESEKLLDVIQQALNYDARLWRVRYFGTKRQEVSARLHTLTPGEWQVLNQLLEGKLNKVIAHELELSVRTIEKRRGDIMKKLQVRHIADLVQLVVSSR